MSDKNTYNLTPDDISLLREISQDILSSLEFDKVINNSILKIVNKLDLIGGVLTLVEGNKLHAKTITGKKAQMFLKLIRGPITKLSINILNEPENLLVKSTLTDTVYISHNLYDFTRGVLSKPISAAANKLTNTKSAVALPLSIRGQRIGALFFSKEVEDQFEKELPILELLSDHIAIAINNANLYKLSEQRADALEDSLKEIHELRRKEKDMIAVLAHEIKTPLTTILGAIQLLNNEISKDETKYASMAQLAKMALKATQRQKELTQRLFSVADADFHEDKVELENVKLIHVTDNSIEIYRPIFNNKNIRLEKKLPKEEIIVKADRMKLIEVIDNLISNALKYTSKGKIKIEIQDMGSKAKFTIKDTGVGIHKEELENLGKKFFRARKGRIKFDDPGGTGLGLYVVNNYLKLMNSKLEIESKLGKGTKFTFELEKIKKNASD